LADPFWLRWPLSRKCGSPEKNTTTPEKILFSGKHFKQIFKKLFLKIFFLNLCISPIITKKSLTNSKSSPFYFLTNSIPIVSILFSSQSSPIHNQTKKSIKSQMSTTKEHFFLHVSKIIKKSKFLF